MSLSASKPTVLTLACLAVLAVALTVTGCSSTPAATDPDTGAGDGSGDAPVAAEGCPAELITAYAGAEGTTLVELEPGDFAVAGVDADILATACLIDLTLDTLHAQTAFFPGDADEITASVNAALSAAGYAPEPDAPSRWTRGTDTQWVVTAYSGADYASLGYGDYASVVTVSEDLHE